MSAEKYPKPHSADDIEEIAERLRKFLGLGDEAYFNIMTVVENVLPAKFPFFVEVLPSEQMQSIEAFTEFDPPRFTINEDVYKLAHRDDGRSRFTVAHELGHLCLHWGHSGPRVAPVKHSLSRSRGDRQLDAEANRFAGAFLMPRTIARRFHEPWRLAQVCRVTKLAASRRLIELWNHSDGYTSAKVRKLFGSNSFEH